MGCLEEMGGNLQVSLTEAWDSRCIHSDLFITAMSEPFSGFVKTISSQRFGCLMAVKSCFGGL